ncbi:DUF4230 domain-containing protein [Marivirga sp. S37H4]|uniref:DUF4230 domain-containing protein n=1 Tax=Marivirga aurantiaca TaxID=2802615 RepID=A0A934X287_9BACT|nr:DUF4230 domain-containing protein [Marivirga aurantiaca]MBK6267112.1 DUF4230 domain-containing protein [Marivirga aurantiaca]
MNFKLIFKFIPWAIALLLLVFLWFRRMSDFTTPERLTVENTTILQEIEALGKLELVKYRFKEVVEEKKVAKKWIKYIPSGPDMTAILIASGEAVACIDLGKIEKQDIRFENDTIYIELPNPELCYFKIDLQNSKIYDLKATNSIYKYFDDENKAAEFIQEMYAKAEIQIKEAALKSGIMEDAEKLGSTILRPFLSNITNKVIVLKFKQRPDATMIFPD